MAPFPADGRRERRPIANVLRTYLPRCFIASFATTWQWRQPTASRPISWSVNDQRLSAKNQLVKPHVILIRCFSPPSQLFLRARALICRSRSSFHLLDKIQKELQENATVGWLIGDAQALTGNSHFRVLFARILQFTYCHRAIVSKSSKVFSLQMTTGSLPGRSLGSISHIFRSSSHLVGPLFITSLK